MTWIPVELEGTEGGGLPGEDGGRHLEYDIPVTEPGQTIVPDAGQQLLAVGVGHKL